MSLRFPVAPNSAALPGGAIIHLGTKDTEMNEIANITGSGPATMTSREIAELCEKRHDHVLRDIERMLLDIGDPKFGASSFEAEYTTPQNKRAKEYRLPKDLTITLVTGYRADLRYRVIKKLEELEGQQRSSPFQIPATYAEALRLAAEQSERIEIQSAAIAEMKPKADFHDEVATAANAQTFMDVAKAMKTGRTRLTRWLRGRKFIMENNRPYQNYMEAGYFRVVEKKRKDPNTGEVFTYVQTLVTGKGVTYLQKKWSEDHSMAGA